MAQLPPDQAAQRLAVNEDKFDKFTNGLAGEDAYAPTGGGPVVPTVAKLVAGLNAQTAITETAINRSVAEVAATNAATSATIAAQARDAGLQNRGNFDNTAFALSNGIKTHKVTNGGSGGTDGPFKGTYTGGGGTRGTFDFTVAGGSVVLSSVLPDFPGENYTSAPAPVYTASAGLIGVVTDPIGIGPNADVGKYFTVPVSGLADKSKLYVVLPGPVAMESFDIPGANTVKKAVALANAYPEAYPSLPFIYPPGAAVRDSSGELRLIDEIKAGEMLRHGTITDPKVAKLVAMGILSERSDLPSIYSRFTRVVLDTNGESRLIEGFNAAGDYVNFAGAAGASGAGGNVEAFANEYQINNSLGQSNERGVGDSTLSPIVPAGVGLAWNPGTAAAIAMADPLPGNAAGAGSMIPAQTNEFFRLTGRGTLAVLSAQGGSSMQVAADSGNGFWDPGTAGNLLQPAFTRLENAKTWLRANNYAFSNTPSFTMTLGEREAQAINAGTPGVSKAGCKAAATRLYNAIQASYPKSVIFVTRIGKEGASDSTGFQQIRDAWDELCQELPYFVMANTGFVRFFERGLVPDGLHASQLGLNELGRKRGRVMAYALSNYA